MALTVSYPRRSRPRMFGAVFVSKIARPQVRAKRKRLRPFIRAHQLWVFNAQKRH